MGRNAIVPFTEINRRAPEAGRIRIGEKTARAMRSIETFRFTSQYEDLIRQLAALYGGDPKPWSDPKARVQNQWEVKTDTASIDVLLPAEGLTQNYELWTGGGCARRCDGVTVETVERVDQDEFGIISSPCICAAKQKAECRPYTRITAVLPELPFLGTWRLETKGWNAAAELPGMFELVRALHDSGQMVQAILGVEMRHDVVNGKKRDYVVPTIGMKESPLAIAAGRADVAALAAAPRTAIGPAPRPALPSSPPSSDQPGADQFNGLASIDDDIDGVIEGEVVDDDELLELTIGKLRRDAEHFGLDTDQFVAALVAAADGNRAELERVHGDVMAGTVEPTSIVDGVIKWRRL